MEEERKHQRESSGLSLEQFLIQSEIKIFIVNPKLENDIVRCHELLQRTNQFNFSQNRYTLEELKKLTKEKSNICLAIRCEDKYGEYGLVGFCVLKRRNKESIELIDFVLSCRVAKKYIENALFAFVLDKFSVNIVTGVFHKTDRNHVLLESLIDAGFSFEAENSLVTIRRGDIKDNIVQVCDMLENPS